jgi:diadenosine tetraphosphate (Ap4A) HIT family hydrolase
MSNAFFASPQRYQAAFSAGLREMLSGYDELGVFILVLANAMIDPLIWDELSGPLRQKFERLSALHADSRQGGFLDDAKDDRRVFSRLMEIGFDAITPIRLRREGPWELQLNPLRALRPPRMTERRVSGLSAPFNPDEFHFAKPFLRKEIFWRGALQGRDVSLLYNKFPFVRLLGLLVPEARAGRPQFLQQADHEYIWRVAAALRPGLPGVGVGYNSYGACASVNHLHFHLFVRDEALPITAAHWSHNGGQVAYPATCARFDDVQEAWRYIRELHGRKVPYNLIAYPDTLYCLPRAPQGGRELPEWSSGYGWYEMAGGCVPLGEAHYRQLDERRLSDELRAVRSTISI